MNVTEEEYNQWPDFMWLDLAREGDGGQTCANCAHEGQCEGLHYCGGTYWEADGEEEEEEEGGAE